MPTSVTPPGNSPRLARWGGTNRGDPVLVEVGKPKVESTPGYVVPGTMHDIYYTDANPEPFCWALGADLFCEESYVTWSPPPSIEQQNNAEITKKRREIRKLGKSGGRGDLVEWREAGGSALAGSRWRGWSGIFRNVVPSGDRREGAKILR